MLNQWQKTWTVDGNELTAAVSPCSWMYPNYGLQVHVKLLSTGQMHYVLRNDLPYEKATEADCEDICAKITFATCACGKPYIRGEEPNDRSKQRTVCEACRVAPILADIAKIEAKEKKREERADARQKAKGMKYKTVMWVHAGGDDYALVMYTSYKPTDEEIKKALKRRGSRVDNDYSTKAL